MLWVSVLCDPDGELCDPDVCDPDDAVPEAPSDEVVDEALPWVLVCVALLPVFLAVALGSAVVLVACAHLLPATPIVVQKVVPLAAMLDLAELSSER